MRQNTLFFEARAAKRDRTDNQSVQSHATTTETRTLFSMQPFHVAELRNALMEVLTHPTSVGGAKTSINAALLTVSHLWLGRVSTPPTAARARSSSLDLSDRARRSHSAPCETAPARSSSNLAADPTS